MDKRTLSKLNVDVVVVGGGAAGVAAATTVARSGLKTVLLERYGFCGGGAVAGLSGTICGLFLASDNPNSKPEQIVHGFAGEFVDRLDQRKGLSQPVRYGKTFTRVHDPLQWRMTADGLLEEAGVRILYHSVVTSVISEDGVNIEGVNAYTNQGPFEIRAKVTIDASGDADVVAMAGLGTSVGKDGVVQNPTMIFRVQGVDTKRFSEEYGDDTIMPPKVSASINAYSKHNLPRSKIWLFQTTKPGELLCNCTRIVGKDGRELNSLYADDFTEAEIQGRIQATNYADFLKDCIIGCEESFIEDTATQVGIRQSRQIVGKTTLTNDDVLNARKSNSGIARSPWPIELHSGERPRVEWILDDFYEVPFGCFQPSKAENLLVAGRCLSAEHEAVASSRVTAQCFEYGHAVGQAAILSINERIPTSRIDGSDVRVVLNKHGSNLN